MTRKKSRVKALALAVTCAILAGGYSGVNPVYADSTAIVYTSDNIHDGNTTINGTLKVKEGSLTLIKRASDMPSDYVESLDIERLGRINNLINYSASGAQTVITAGDGSTIGGVGFTAGALTGVTSINDSNSNFTVSENNIKLGYLKITATNAGITFADMNSTYADGSPVNVITISDMKTASDNTKGMSRDKENDRFDIERNVTAIENQVKIRSDGRIEINTTGSNSEQSVVIDSGAGILVGHQDQVKKLLDQDSSVTAEQKKAYLNKTAGISYAGVFAGGIKFDEAKAGMSNVDGSLKAASGKFKVDADGAISAAGKKFEVTKDGELKLEDKLTIQHKGFGVDVTKSASLDIDGLSKLNQLVDYSSGAKTVITAGDDSKIGGVTISGGRLSVSMGSATVGVNVSDLAADHDIITNDKQYTYSSKTVKSKIDSLEQADAAFTAQTAGIHRIAKDFDGISKAGTSIENTLEVYENGTVIINDNTTQQVTIDSNGIKVGKLVSASGSQIGDITISGSTLSAEGSGSIKIADLVNDHNKVINDTIGNEALFERFKGVKKLDPTSEGKAGSSIEDNLYVYEDGSLKAANSNFRVSADGDIAAAGELKVANDKFTVDKNGNVYAKGILSVASGKFYVDANGVVTAGSMKMDNIEGADSNKGVTVGGVVLKNKTITAADGKFTVNEYGNIVSAGTLSIGNVSLIANDHVGADGKWVYNDQNIGDDAKFKVSDGKIAYKVGNYSVTTSSATATRDNDVDQANKGTVFSNDTNYTRIDGAEVNSVNGASTGKLDGASLELKSEHGNIKLINNQGTFTDANGNYTEISGARITTSIITAKEGVNAKTISIGAHAGDFWQQEFYVDENGNVYTTGMLSAAGGRFLVSADGAVSAADGKFKVDADGAFSAANNKFTVDKDGNVAADGTLSVAGGKFQVDANGVVTAGSVKMDNIEGANGAGVTVGGVNLKDKTITAADGSFKVDADGAVSAANNKLTVDKNGNVAADGTLSAAGGKFNVDANGAVSAANNKLTVDKNGNVAADGTLSAAGGKFKVDENGTFSAAGGKFTVNADGTFSAAGGNFQIDKEGTITAGSMKMDNIEAADPKKGVTVGGVNLKDNKITASNGNFDEIIANEGKKNQVKIDSNGIKVGNNSSFISDDGFRTSGDLYIGTKTAPTEEATDARFQVKGSDGSFKAADGKFKVDGDGAVSAADGKFKVDKDGKTTFTGSSGSSLVIDGDNLEIIDADDTTGANKKSINLSDLADVGKDMANLSSRISDVNNRVNKVGAMAAAIASLKTMGYDPESPTEVSVGVGHYKGETGVAFGFFHYPNKNFMINVSLSTAGGETMGGIGATWRFGHKSPQKLLEEQRAAQAEKEIAAAEAYKAARKAKNNQ